MHTSQRKQRKRARTVLAFGTFDVLHPGHLSYLRQAKRLGDRLVVVLARDGTIMKGKGRPPLFSESERKALVSAVRDVDDVVLGDETDHFRVLARIVPDVVCLGYDHRVTTQELHAICKERGVQIPLIRRARAYNPGRYKSHLLKRAL